jgi:hypothetical protein
MVWAGISINRDEILKTIVRPYADAIGETFRLVQDNARAHNARIARNFFDDEGIEVIDCPARSPDLNHAFS